jgi:hypothetical protein
MRIIILALSLWLFAVPAKAQDTPQGRHNCYPVAAGGRVEVTTQAGPIHRATLLCIGNEKVVIATDGRIETIPLHDVQAIVKPADGIGDGFLKGAAVAAIFGVLCRGCGDAGYWMAATVVYGGIGAAIDALHGGSETLYRRNLTRPGPPRAAVAWRVRF